jgi:hypothetical protein
MTIRKTISQAYIRKNFRLGRYNTLVNKKDPSITLDESDFLTWASRKVQILKDLGDRYLVKVLANRKYATDIVIYLEKFWIAK